jgi:hypothetical protein
MFRFSFFFFSIIADESKSEKDVNQSSFNCSDKYLGKADLNDGSINENLIVSHISYCVSLVTFSLRADNF